jgi:hypothetical protein
LAAAASLHGAHGTCRPACIKEVMNSLRKVQDSVHECPSQHAALAFCRWLASNTPHLAPEACQMTSLAVGLMSQIG